MENISRREKEKLMREDEIISAAEKIFIHTGFEKASMDEIASEAQFTRKTVYQHFINKEDLYIAVVVRGFKQLLSCIQQEEETGNNGFEKLRLMGFAYYQFYKKHPDAFRLMNLVGHIKSKEESTYNHQEFNKVNNYITEEIVKVVNAGKTDGSIRDDLDTIMITHSAQFVMTGFFYELSLAGETFTDHFSINQEDFVDFILHLLFDAFEAKNKYTS
jgi:AcrR family transcriptional regulator